VLRSAFGEIVDGKGHSLNPEFKINNVSPWVVWWDWRRRPQASKRLRWLRLLKRRPQVSCTLVVNG